MTRYLLDTNMILRFLRNDDPKLSPQAVSLFSQVVRRECVLAIPQLILAECVYVLSSFYRTDRESLATALIILISQPGIETEDRAVALAALRRYGESKIDYADCYLLAKAKHDNNGITTFDRDIAKIADVPHWEPAPEEQP